MSQLAMSFSVVLPPTSQNMHGRTRIHVSSGAAPLDTAVALPCALFFPPNLDAAKHQRTISRAEKQDERDPDYGCSPKNLP